MHCVWCWTFLEAFSQCMWRVAMSGTASTVCGGPALDPIVCLDPQLTPLTPVLTLTGALTSTIHVLNLLG